MHPNTPDAATPRGSPRSLLPTIGALFVIVVNALIVWFFLVGIPSDCARLAAETDGRQTCGVEPVAYVIVGISVILIIACVGGILKWNMHRTQ
ncbi:MAG: hypothetical protein WC295_02680 [Methanoregula sp.]|jgi:type III secretory pathway component EscU